MAHDSIIIVGILGKTYSRRHFGIFFSLFPESRLWSFIQTVSFGEESLCMKCQSLFSEKSKGKYFKMSSSEFTQRVLKAKALSDIVDGILFVLQCILIFQRR